MRAALDSVYAEHLPAELGGGPWVPSLSVSRTELAGEWAGQIAEVHGLEAPDTREYTWSIAYTAPQYVGLVTTHSETRLLDDAARARFLHALRDAIELHGGSFTLPMRTLACVARAIGSR